MKKLIAFLCFTAAARCFAADGVAVFQAGLQAFQVNGPEALLRVWYSADEEQKREEIKARLTRLTEKLGPVADTQVFKPRNLGRHVQRLYGVIYFQKRPVWLRAEYYSIDGRGGFISLEFSLNADDILPLEMAPARE